MDEKREAGQHHRPEPERLEPGRRNGARDERRHAGPLRDERSGPVNKRAHDAVIDSMVALLHLSLAPCPVSVLAMNTPPTTSTTKPMLMIVEVAIQQRLDRRAELPEQQAHQHELHAARNDGGPDEGEERQVDEARGDGDQLERDRRRALDEDDLRAIITQIAGRLGETRRQVQPGRAAWSRRSRTGSAPPHSQATRPRPKPGADHAITQRPLRPSKTHQAQQRMRRNGKDTRFQEGEENEPPFGVAVRGLGQRPVVEALEHREGH